jgi:hypothetical protein
MTERMPSRRSLLGPTRGCPPLECLLASGGRQLIPERLRSQEIERAPMECQARRAQGVRSTQRASRHRLTARSYASVVAVLACVKVDHLAVPVQGEGDQERAISPLYPINRHVRLCYVRHRMTMNEENTICGYKRSEASL